MLYLLVITYFNNLRKCSYMRMKLGKFTFWFRFDTQFEYFNSVLARIRK